MRYSHYLWGCGAGFLSLVALAWGEGTSTQNPYQPIVERNIFHLRPPPDPTTNAPAPVAPPPRANVILTGITTIFGPSSKRALLEITEQATGKQASPSQPRKPILREGERDGTVEVVAINVEKNTVLVRIDDLETNLTFSVPKTASAPTPAGASGPGRTPTPQPALNFAAAVAQQNAALKAQSPTIISRAPSDMPIDRSGISLSGADPMAASAPALSSSASANTTLSSLRAGTSDTLGFGLPTRQIRTESQGQNVPQSAEESIIMVELNREKARMEHEKAASSGTRVAVPPPSLFPPTPLNPKAE